jgi:hypothetical protein
MAMMQRRRSGSASVSVNGSASAASLAGDLLLPAAGDGNGLGSLADELADAWYGDEDDDEEGQDDTGVGLDETDAYNLDNGHAHRQISNAGGQEAEEGEEEENTENDGAGGPLLHRTAQTTEASLFGEQTSSGVNLGHAPRRKHRRKPSQNGSAGVGGDGDASVRADDGKIGRRGGGSGGGGDDDDDDDDDSSTEEANELYAALEARLAEIETLAQRGAKSVDGQDDPVVDRVLDELRDLGAQSNVEGGTSRLVHSSAIFMAHLHLPLYVLFFPFLMYLFFSFPLSFPSKRYTLMAGTAKGSVYLFRHLQSDYL